MSKLKTFISGFLVIMMALIFNSCAENEFVMDNTTQAITFSSDYVGRPASRALGDITNDNVTSSSFYVWGRYYDGNYSDNTDTKPIFNAQEVINENGAWTYTPLKYWDNEKNYTFTGVMPADKINENDVTYTNDGKIFIENIPLTQVIKNHSDENVGIDYLVSKAVDDHSAANGTVLMQFKHILSRFSIYVYTSADATVTLDRMSMYLPDGTATYEEVEHDSPKSQVVNATGVTQEGDRWTWKGFTNKTDGTNSTYKMYRLLETPKKVPYYDGIPTAANVSDGLLPIEFFMAPIQYDKLAQKEDLQLYMTLKFHVKYPDGIEQDILRTTPIPIQDLHTFTQNYKTNLFVKLLAENDIIAFNVTVDDFEGPTNHWVDQYGYSFDLMSYEQTFDGKTPKPEIHGILDNYGNTLQGDSETELTYRLVNLRKDNKEFLQRDIPLVFNKWDNKVNGEFNEDHTTYNRYGNFTIDLTGLYIEDGWYTMFIKNSMNDVREYQIELKNTMPNMSFTISVGNNDTYAIPFVTYESASKYFDIQISQEIANKEFWLPLVSNSESTANAYAKLFKNLDTWCIYQLSAGYGITGVTTKDFCFTYPSSLIIDWGDNSSFKKISAGDYVIDDNLPTHTYNYEGNYTITIYSNQYDFTKSQIPQLSWSNSHVQINNVLKSNNGDGLVDNKLVSIDSPILHMTNNWYVYGLTFGASPIAAGHNLYKYGFLHYYTGAVIADWNNELCNYTCSPLSGMFNTTRIEKLCDEPFKYNNEYDAFDFTFQFCHNLKTIPASLFKDCNWVQSFYYTFDNSALTSVPAGLFNDTKGYQYQDSKGNIQTVSVWFKCTFIDCVALNDTNVADRLFDNCTFKILNGTFNGTGVTKYQ